MGSGCTAEPVQTSWWR